MINKDVISKLKPCKDRFDNYLKFYSTKSHTKRQFMGLKNITHQDKTWVAFRLMSKENIALAAADIAELVLPLFEAKYPNDKRPRLAIEAARSKTMTIEEKFKAAADAAHAASYAAFYAASYAAFYAASYAADAAAYTAYTAANHANHAANAAKLDGLNIEKKIRTIILRYWK